MPRAWRAACRGGLWRFLEKGSGDDAVVFLHGWMSGGGAWREVLRRLDGPYRLLAPDLPGFGGTRPAPGFDYSIPAYAAAVEEFLSARTVERAAVVGWSFGGAVALWMAAHHPRRVSRLVLINSAGGSPDMHLIHRLGGHPVPGAAVWRLPRVVWDYFIRRAAETPGGGLAHMPGWFVEYQRRLVSEWGARRAGYGVMRWLVRLRREGRRALIDSAVGRIRQPTLILWGENDRSMPLEHGLNLQRSIFGARLAVLADCAHCPPVEAPAAVARALADFLSSPAVPAAPEPRSSTASRPPALGAASQSTRGSSRASSNVSSHVPVSARQDG